MRTKEECIAIGELHVLVHSGTKGMKWGFTDGSANGNVTAGGFRKADDASSKKINREKSAANKYAELATAEKEKAAQAKVSKENVDFNKLDRDNPEVSDEYKQEMGLMAVPESPEAAPVNTDNASDEYKQAMGLMAVPKSPEAAPVNPKNASDEYKQETGLMAVPKSPEAAPVNPKNASDEYKQAMGLMAVPKSTSNSPSSSSKTPSSSSTFTLGENGTTVRIATGAKTAAESTFSKVTGAVGDAAKSGAGAVGDAAKSGASWVKGLFD